MKKRKKDSAENIGFFSAVKTLSKSIREYKKPSLLAPIFVGLEVVVECLIPYLMTLLLGAMNYLSGMDANPRPLVLKILNLIGASGQSDMLKVILWFGLGLLLLAFISLSFGALAGKFCAIASSGFAKNLRKDMFYKMQNFSFSNIDKFSSSSLVMQFLLNSFNLLMLGINKLSSKSILICSNSKGVFPSLESCFSILS